MKGALGMEVPRLLYVPHVGLNCIIDFLGLLRWISGVVHFLQNRWCNVDLTEDQVDALWTQTHQTLDSLTSFVTPSVSRGSPDGAREG
jgi:hypothetical protein